MMTSVMLRQDRRCGSSRPLGCFLTILSAGVVILGSASDNPARAGHVFTILETVDLPQGGQLLGVQDMDADGRLDVVLRGSGSVKVFERSGASFVERFSASSSRGGVIGDVDGDGRFEIATATSVFPSRLTVYEANGDNVYTQIFTQNNFQRAIEGNPVTGDSDNDGRMEYLVPQESVPSRVRIFEATGNNAISEVSGLNGTYISLTFFAAGGSGFVAWLS